MGILLSHGGLSAPVAQIVPDTGPFLFGQSVHPEVSESGTGPQEQWHSAYYTLFVITEGQAFSVPDPTPTSSRPVSIA